MIEHLLGWWQARAPRERTVIAAPAAVLAVAALWAYLWVPIEADRARLVESLPRLRATAHELGREAAEVEGLRAAVRARVQVNLRAVPFDALARAVAQLAEAHGLAVEMIALKASGEPGKVQVETLVLRTARGG